MTIDQMTTYALYYRDIRWYWYMARGYPAGDKLQPVVSLREALSMPRHKTGTSFGNN
jgi:hypothetical protein